MQLDVSSGIAVYLNSPSGLDRVTLAQPMVFWVQLPKCRTVADRGGFLIFLQFYLVLLVEEKFQISL